MPRFPVYREEWGQCDYCGFDVPVSRLKYDEKYGWQCTGYPGANCVDSRPDREDYEQMRRFPPNEGIRQSTAPITNSQTEGVGDEAEDIVGGGYGITPYGTGPYGK